MTDQQNNLEFSLLSERINAQIEVHEKFSQAFTRILELLEQTNGKIEELKKEYMGDLRELSNEVIKIAEDLAHHNENLKALVAALQDDINKNTETLQDVVTDMQVQKKLIEDIFPSIQELSKQISTYENRSDKTQKANLNQLQELQKKINELLEDMSGSSEDVAKKLEDISEMSKKIANINSKIETLFKDRQGRKSMLKNIAIWAGALAFVIGVIETLVQLGVITIVFGGK